MAMMEPVSGLSSFLTVLAELRFGQRSPFPFYGALLYTVAEGLDAELGRYVDAHWDELDAMTGDKCLVFTVGDAHDEAAAGHRPFRPQEIYAIADHLGVRPSALPCAAFFASVDESREIVCVRLADYLGRLQGPDQAGAWTRAFRSMATAIERCVDIPVDQRLDCLREALVRERERAFSDVASGDRGDKLQSAASTAEAVDKVLVSGVSIGSTVLRALGLGI